MFHRHLLFGELLWQGYGGTRALCTATKCSKGLYSTATVQDGTVVSQEIEHVVAMRSSIPGLNIDPEELNARNRYLYIHVQSSIIHNSRNVKAITVSIDGWTDTQNVMLYYYTVEHLFTLKKGGNYGTCYNMDEPWFLEKLSQMKQTNHKDKYHMIHLCHT